MSELGQRCLDLVAVPSVTGQEEALCDQLWAWSLERFPTGRRGRWRHGFWLDPTGSSRPVALVGHLDTVPPAASQPVEIRDGKVYGCGASDMKAGVAVMMSLLEARPEAFLGVFYDREEGPYDDNGLDGLLDMMPPIELAMVLEPSCNRIQAGCLGGLHARVRVAGQRAHSARPWQGRNAITEALPLLARLAEWPRREVVCGGLPFYEVVSVTQASTDNPRNAIPEAFELNVNFRFAPGRTLTDAEAELRELIGQPLEIIDASPSGTVDLSQPRLAAWIERHQLAVEPKQAWTDVARLSGRGIPAVNFGPGTPAQAHQAGEWCEVALLEECYQLMLDL